MKIKRFIEKIIIRKAKTILKKRIGQKQYQSLFENFYSISSLGMNIGGGAETESSGEKNALLYIRDKLKKIDKVVIFDVGANVGMYTILLNEVFSENSKILSFEPSKKTFNKLGLNTNHIKHTNLFNFGFGNTNNFLTLYYNQEESGLASVYKRKLDHFNIKMDLKEEIEIKTIDSFCEKRSINKIDFLKLDVEGHELSVLNGAIKMINNHKINFIQFEFGGCNIDSRTYFQDFYYLLNKEFYIYRIVKDGLFEIDTYKEMYEAFTTTNYLAERKEL
ncbi:FkbM family methyltransferase [Flavobacterium gawalongense]|nr:FkbM family methyltransferase [Flavobacterium gawalongense]